MTGRGRACHCSDPLVISGFCSGSDGDELAVLREAGVDWAHVTPAPGTSFDEFKSQVELGPPV